MQHGCDSFLNEDWLFEKITHIKVVDTRGRVQFESPFDRDRKYEFEARERFEFAWIKFYDKDGAFVMSVDPFRRMYGRATILADGDRMAFSNFSVTLS